MQNLPRLTIELIKSSCSDRSFERGEEYYRNRAIIRHVLHKSVEDSCVILTAECEGTSNQNYRVSVFLTEYGISEASCSCPYDWGGYCKHIVALLLVYLNEKEKFSRDGLSLVLSEIAAKLMAQDKENLVLLFLAILKEEPSLLQLFQPYVACWEGYFSAQFLPDEGVIKEGYLLFVELAFGRGFVEEERQKEALEKLNAMKASAQKKAQRGDFYYAALILQALVSGCLNRYEDTHNKRAIFGFVSECLSLLQVALEKAELTKEKRQQWLLEMFECRNQIGKNLQGLMCSLDFEGKLDEFLLSVCLEEDVPILLSVAKLKKELLDREKAEERSCPCAEVRHTGEAFRLRRVSAFDAYRGVIPCGDLPTEGFPRASIAPRWERRNIIKFILGLYEIAKRTDDYMKLAYAEGEGFLYVQKLIERKEIDKAMEYIQEKPLNVDEYFPLAEKLASLGLRDKVPLLMEIGLQIACDSRSVLVEKFASYFLAYRNFQLALSALVACFELRSEIRILNKIRKVAKRLGRWAETREKLTSELLAKKKYELLTKIYLDDGEIENAITTARRFIEKPIRGKDARTITFRRNSLMRKVASEAEKSYPIEAILIYQKLAKAQIAKVDRRAYRRALFYLEKIKHLYTLLGETATWQDYIAKLRGQNIKKMAFLEEIREL